MARQLTKAQDAVRAYVQENPGAGIQEVAEALHMTYGKAQRVLRRLADMGHLWREREREHAGRVLYFPTGMDEPGPLDDPALGALESLWALPAVKGEGE